ncbi:hypothetical protein M0804_007500 [Polistes exclamans]|nr:hypothetical protein M0804_007500 [Polistes exclamans]
MIVGVSSSGDSDGGGGDGGGGGGFVDGRILELHSPDGVHECWLRAADNTEANVWFNALHSALAALTLKALRLASAVPDPPQLQHIGQSLERRVAEEGGFRVTLLESEIRLAESVCEAVTCNPQERHTGGVIASQNAPLVVLAINDDDNDNDNDDDDDDGDDDDDDDDDDDYRSIRSIHVITITDI